MTILWREYNRIRNKKGCYTDNDVKILLFYIESLNEMNQTLGDDLKTAFDTIDNLRNRVEFYRHATAMKKVLKNGCSIKAKNNEEDDSLTS